LKSIDDILFELHLAKDNLDKKDHPEVKTYINERITEILQESLNIVIEKNLAAFNKLFFTQTPATIKLFENENTKGIINNHN
jgi:hypothetical protein